MALLEHTFDYQTAGKRALIEDVRLSDLHELERFVAKRERDKRMNDIVARVVLLAFVAFLVWAWTAPPSDCVADTAGRFQEYTVCR